MTVSQKREISSITSSHCLRTFGVLTIACMDKTQGLPPNRMRAAGNKQGAAADRAAPRTKRNSRNTPTISIGCIYPMAGRAARLGHDSMIAAELAAEEINGAGGVLGHDIRLLRADERSDPTAVVREAARFIQEDRVDSLMGIYSSAVAMAVSQVAREYRTVFVGTEHASSRLTLEDFHRYYFRVNNGTLQCMRAGAIYASAQGWERYLWIAADYEYGHRQYNEFRAHLAKLRPGVRFMPGLWPRLFEGDYGPFIERIRRVKPDVVIHGFSGGDAVAFTQQARASGLFEEFPVASFDAGGDYPVFEALGEQMPAGVIVGTRHHLRFPDTPANRDFVHQFHERTSRYPSQAAAGAYIGVQFIAAAVAKAGKVGDPDAFVDAAEGLSLKTLKDRQEKHSWMRAVDHQIVQDHVIGISEPNDQFPPARFATGQWRVIEAEQILPTGQEVLKARRAQRDERPAIKRGYTHDHHHKSSKAATHPR